MGVNAEHDVSILCGDADFTDALQEELRFFHILFRMEKLLCHGLKGIEDGLRFVENIPHHQDQRSRQNKKKSSES